MSHTIIMWHTVSVTYTGMDILCATYSAIEWSCSPPDIDCLFYLGRVSSPDIKLRAIICNKNKSRGRCMCDSWLNNLHARNKMFDSDMETVDMVTGVNFQVILNKTYNIYNQYCVNLFSRFQPPCVSNLHSHQSRYRCVTCEWLTHKRSMCSFK